MTICTNSCIEENTCPICGKPFDAWDIMEDDFRPNGELFRDGWVYCPTCDKDFNFRMIYTFRYAILDDPDNS